jgi:hypothetical protein
MYEMKPNAGSLFRNRNEKDGGNQPNLKGTALVQLDVAQLAIPAKNGGKLELTINGSTKESEKAGKWISLSIKPKLGPGAPEKKPAAE